MENFIELPYGQSTVLINIEKIVYIKPYQTTKSIIYFCVRSGDKALTSLIVNVDYESLKAQL